MAENIPKVLTSQDCLVTLMMAISASDGRILTAELVKIQSAVNHLPIFADYDVDRFTLMSQVVFNLFEKEEGLDMLFGLIRENLPDRLFETAYALCCDVAAADGIIREPELRLLEEMRYELNIDRLHAAAIERGARAPRHCLAQFKVFVTICAARFAAIAWPVCSSNAHFARFLALRPIIFAAAQDPDRKWQRHRVAKPLP